MISNNIMNTLKKAGLVLSLAFTFVILSGVEANAQWRNDDYNRRQDRRDDRRDQRRERRDDYNRNNDYYRNGNVYGRNMGYGYNVARQEGYRDGLKAGADDARDRERFNPQKHSDFKKATDGYNRNYGDKGQYRQAYRDAFMQGYREGFSRYGNGNYRSNNGRWGY